MTTLPKELSPERCHQLREGGFLRVLVNLFHEHTFELQNKPEADFNMELFLMEFNRKFELRTRLSRQLRTIVEHTAKNEYELKILGKLETIRKYIELLYNYINDWKAMTEDAGKLTECTVQLDELPGTMEKAIEELEVFAVDDTTRPIFEQFGGVLVIVDYLRAQTRFNAKCHQFESDQIDSTPLLRFAKDSKFVLTYVVVFLYNLVIKTDWNDDIRVFLGDSRSLHEIMLAIAEDAYSDGDLFSVQTYCYLLFHLYHIIFPIRVLPSTFHLKDCGVIQCLAKFGKEIKHPETLCRVFMALEASLEFVRQNVLEFVSIDGAVDMFIDVLVPSKEKAEDVENAKWYGGQRHYSAYVLMFINGHLFTQNGRIDGPLLAIYESRDFASILVHHLEQITSLQPDLILTSTHESSHTICNVLALLRVILSSSEYQRWIFTEIGNGMEMVKRFESSGVEFYVRLSKKIVEIFE